MESNSSPATSRSSISIVVAGAYTERRIACLSVDSLVADVDVVLAALGVERVAFCALGDAALLACHFAAIAPTRVASIVFVQSGESAANRRLLSLPHITAQCRSTGPWCVVWRSGRQAQLCGARFRRARRSGPGGPAPVGATAGDHVVVVDSETGGGAGSLLTRLRRRTDQPGCCAILIKYLATGDIHADRCQVRHGHLASSGN